MKSYNFEESIIFISGCRFGVSLNAEGGFNRKRTNLFCIFLQQQNSTDSRSRVSCSIQRTVQFSRRVARPVLTVICTIRSDCS